MPEKKSVEELLEIATKEFNTWKVLKEALEQIVKLKKEGRPVEEAGKGVKDGS